MRNNTVFVVNFGEDVEGVRGWRLCCLEEVSPPLGFLLHFVVTLFWTEVDVMQTLGVARLDLNPLEMGPTFSLQVLANSHGRTPASKQLGAIPLSTHAHT
eukprot:5425280-Amphidinium_carterae.1